MSIEKTRGRQGNIRDSGYYRLFESQSTDNRYDEVAQQLARLVSKVHSASICNGSRLETFISNEKYNSNTPVRNYSVQNVLCIKEGHYTNILFDKELWFEEDGTSKLTSKKLQSTEVDYMIVRNRKTEHAVEGSDRTSYEKEIILFEIKDGDTFDTKKSREELQSLVAVRDLLLRELTDTIVKCYVVLWNSRDISKNGFKARIDGVQLVNGEEMCRIIGGISYKDIVYERKSIGDENLSYCITKMKDIVKIYEDVMNTNTTIPSKDGSSDCDPTDVIATMLQTSVKISNDQ